MKKEKKPETPKSECSVVMRTGRVGIDFHYFGYCTGCHWEDGYLHYYFQDAREAMDAHLKKNKPKAR